jgi:hypothetical protein
LLRAKCVSVPLTFPGTCRLSDRWGFAQEGLHQVFVPRALDRGTIHPMGEHLLWTVPVMGVAAYLTLRGAMVLQGSGRHCDLLYTEASEEREAGE